MIEQQGGAVAAQRTTRVGVIGLGDIGRGVAASCAAAGLSLAVCDVRDEALEAFADQATVTRSPALLAEQSDVVVVAVVNDAQVLSVTTGDDGVLGSASEGTVVVIVSTISPAALASVAEAAATVGVAVVDCGVSGGPSAAATGELISMVGGSEEDITTASPVLDAMSSLVVRMGSLGTGLLAKLARNVVQYGGWLAAYEGQRIAEAGGIELAKLAQVIRASDAKIGGAATLMFRPTVAPFGPDDHEGLVASMAAGAALAAKDLAAALEAADELGLVLPGVEVTASHIDDVFGVGGGDA
jgi:3-hydroxyisobutyrate dehydrogenase